MLIASSIISERMTFERSPWHLNVPFGTLVGVSLGAHVLSWILDLLQAPAAGMLRFKAVD